MWYALYQILPVIVTIPERHAIDPNGGVGLD